MDVAGAVHVSVHLDGQDPWQVRQLGPDLAGFAAIDLADTVSLLSGDPEQLGRLAELLTRAAAELVARREEPGPLPGGHPGAAA